MINPERAQAHSKLFRIILNLAVVGWIVAAVVLLYTLRASKSIQHTAAETEHWNRFITPLDKIGKDQPLPVVLSSFDKLENFQLVTEGVDKDGIRQWIFGRTVTKRKERITAYGKHPDQLSRIDFDVQPRQPKDDVFLLDVAKDLFSDRHQVFECINDALNANDHRVPLKARYLEMEFEFTDRQDGPLLIIRMANHSEEKS